MKYYIKIHIWEYFFVVMIAFGLTLNVFSSYVIETPLISNYIVVGTAIAVLSCLLFIAGYNKKTTIIGIVVSCLFAVVFVIVLGRLGNALGLFWGILILCTYGAYLCSRNQKLLIIFAVGALFACAAFRFLRYPVSTIGFFVLVVGLILELLYRVYYLSVVKALYGSFNFSKYVGQSVAVVLLVVLMSTGIFYGVVKPMNPPTRELQLINEFMSWDTLEKIGVSSSTQVQTPQKNSNVTDDKKKDYTNEKNETQSEEKDKNEEQQEKDKNETIQKQTNNVLNAFAIRYKQSNYLWVLTVLVVLVLVSLPFIIKFLLRKKQKERLETSSPKDGVMFLYDYFLRKYKILHFARDPSLTLCEYVESYSKEFDKYDSENGVKFKDLTDIYTKIIYGEYIPSEDEYSKYKDFYYSFFENVKKSIGKPKYAFMFWRI